MLSPKGGRGWVWGRGEEHANSPLNLQLLVGEAELLLVTLQLSKLLVIVSYGGV